MKKIYILFFLALLLSGTLNSQKIVFAYDAAGNRISRSTIVMDKQNASKSQSASEDQEPVTEQLDEARKLKIYPNPTKGILRIEITGRAENEELAIYLFNSQGILLQSFQSKENFNHLNMTGYPEGTYILRIHSAEKTVEYKIIKQ